MNKLYTDSSLKEACWVLDKEGNHTTICLNYPAPLTVNQGEYTALLWALNFTEKQQLDSVEVFSDSQLMVNQINGKYHCRDKPLQELRGMVLPFFTGKPWATLTWIPREKNLAGIFLEKRRNK